MGRRSVVLGIVAAALATPGPALAYGWPVKPFHREHPIRGAFNDPRFHLGAAGEAIGSFHFGVDIAVPDGTPVYAVEAGRVSRGLGWVAVRRPNRREFGYWHVAPVVRRGAHVRRHQLLGFVQRGWGHVHFAESVAGVYRNPLRKGALTPYRDEVAPVVDGIDVSAPPEAPGLAGFVGWTPGSAPLVASGPLSGTVAFFASAYDLPDLAPAAPWARAVLTPGLVRWRIVDAAGDPTPWRVAADLRYRLARRPLFPDVFAPGTYQNKPNRPGCYRVWLTRAFDTATLSNGTYWIVVEARDVHNNVGAAELPITIANPGQ